MTIDAIATVRDMKALDQYSENVIANVFDAVAEQYGEVAFLRKTAQALVEAVPARHISDALDVATGPGTAALLLARRFADAQVTAVDIAPEMVDQGRSRAHALGLPNVSFVNAPATSLPFKTASFDLVVCSSAIYYMADMQQALAEWVRVLRPGGTLAFSTYGLGMLEPMCSLFDARVRAYGVLVPQPTPLYRLTAPEACRALLMNVGCVDVVIQPRQLGSLLPTVDAYWSTLMTTGFRLLVSALESEARASFEQEHKREVAQHITPDGLWLNVPALVALGHVSKSESPA
jgi:ubiquinone/menaquinone biosynthesis C-methylase UbiE